MTMTPEPEGAAAASTQEPAPQRGLPGSPRSRTIQKIREGIIIASLVGCGVFSVLVTFSIIAVLFRESIGFFGVHGDDSPGSPNVVFQSAEAGALDVATPERLMLSEIRTHQLERDGKQFVEIAGPPRSTLDGLWLLVVSRGTAKTGSGVVELAIDLSGAALDRSGYFVMGSKPRLYGKRMNRVLDHEFAIHHNSTHLLVRGFSGNEGDDLDPEDVGTLSVQPWSELVDALALLSTEPADESTGGWGYSDQTMGPYIEDEIPVLVYRDPFDQWAWKPSVGESITVTFTEFITGGEWNPLLGHERHFGIWPLITGTLLVAGIAALIAIPLGLITAVYLSEYAPRRLRAVLKPVLEILAGIPTVVYGFFALTVITPALQSLGRWFTGSAPGEWLGSVTGWWTTGDALFEAYNAGSAGIAVGIMCLPLVTSLSEDALQAVPRSLREGAYAVGGTKFDVSVKVVVPAALSGVVAAFLLAIARAVGETMAVSLAAGGLANLTLNPTESIQTMTAWMVQIFLGDASNFGPEYRSAYAVAAVLFVMTLMLTILGARVLKRFREVYE